MNKEIPAESHAKRKSPQRGFFNPLAAIIAAILSLFAGHDIVASNASQAAASATAVVPAAIVTTTTISSPPPIARSPVVQTTILRQPIAERIVDQVISQPNSDIATITSQFTNLQNQINTIVARLNTQNTPTTVIPQQIAGEGNGGYSGYGAAQNISQLTNTAVNTPTITGGTITNASVSGTGSFTTLTGATGIFNTLQSGNLGIVSTIVPQISIGYSATSTATLGIDSSGNLNLGTQTHTDVPNGGYVAGLNLANNPFLTIDTGAQSMAIGNGAFPSFTYLSATSSINTPDYGITAIGDSALGSLPAASTSNAYFDTAIGANALYGLIGNSNWNTALGYSAGVNLISGFENTLIGGKAMKNATSSGANVIVGDQTAGSYTGSGYLTVVGSLAGNSLTTGSSDTLLGYHTNVSSGTLTNATAIGANAIVGASNSLVLGGTGLNAVNVGIGNTTPSYLLDVNGTGHFTSFVDAANFVATSSTATSTFAGGLTVGSSALNVLQNGNVGIGTASPAEKLHVNGTIEADDGAADANGFSGFTWAGGAGSPVISIGWPGSTASTSFIKSSDGDNHSLGIGAATTGTGNVRLLAGLGSVIFMNNGIESMRMASNSNLGIGTTSPYAKLSVTSTAIASTTLALKAATGQTANILDIYNSSGTLNSVINSSGSVGIGTTSPTTALQVNGVITPNADNTSSLGNSTYRWSAVYAANGTIQTSDARLKSNITPSSYGLDQIMQLNPVSFTWKDHPEQGTKLGFIAQQVKSIIPEVVTVGDDAMETLGLNYTELIPAIVHSIQQIASISGTFETNLIAWLGSGNNGLTKVCVQKTDGSPICVTGDQLAAVLAATGQQSAPSAPLSAPSTPSGSSASTTPVLIALPKIQINGDNPAKISVGSSYADLGATITGPQADLNLDITTYLNGTKVASIQLDTSTTSTSTIDYVVTDQFGTTATTTRTVIVQ